MKKTENRAELGSRAYALFEEFRGAYAGEWRRLERAERIYFGDHWCDAAQADPSEPRPSTPVIQSTVENIAADLMDSLPEAVIVPEKPADTETARVLEAVIRQNHDAACYEREYRRMAHDLLVGGYAVQEVGYDPAANGGLGGAFIRHADNRGVMFDPLCTDIQDGRAVFKFAARTKEWLAAHFPRYSGGSDGFGQTAAQEDFLLRADRSKTALLIEFWWKEYDADGRARVHMAQLAGGELLADSRETKPEGYFAHGQYPFLVSPLFARKGSPLGLGLVDMFATQQIYADKLNQIMLKNALMASHNKLLITEASGFDPGDLRDWAKEVHVGESLNGVSWFATPPLPSYIMQYINNMLSSIKEESGANDFSRGGTMGGITAASAIAALQEMSGKRSRMAAKQLHEAYKDAVRMEIEVEREFNLLPRAVFVTVDGKAEQRMFDGRCIGRTEGELPIEFSISIKVQKQNRFSVISQNELVLQMLHLGVLRPEQAVELMHFEGKEHVLEQARRKAAPEGPVGGPSALDTPPDAAQAGPAVPPPSGRGAAIASRVKRMLPVRR